MDLDKDLVGQKTNIYSPETCSFVPHFINTLFEDRDCKSLIEKNKEGYKASVFIINRKIDVGIFESEKEAKEGIQTFKENYIQDIAEKNKGKIPDYVYDAMMEWKVAI